MPHLRCPVWIGYFLASPVRRLFQKPGRILEGLVQPGMQVLDLSPGMGFFTLPLARLVGPDGRVVAVDVQAGMLEGLQRRARKAGLGERITTRVCSATSLELGDLAGAFDFALAFAMIHELPDIPHFFEEVVQTLKPGASLLIAEPKGHVTRDGFGVTLQAAKAAGFEVVGRPRIAYCHAAMLQKASA